MQKNQKQKTTTDDVSSVAVFFYEMKARVGKMQPGWLFCEKHRKSIPHLQKEAKKQLFPARIMAYSHMVAYTMSPSLLTTDLGLGEYGLFYCVA